MLAVRRNPNATIIHANETLIRSEDLSFETSINVNVYQTYVITALKTAIFKHRFLRTGGEFIETGLQKCLTINCNWSLVKTLAVGVRVKSGLSVQVIR
jgi:hypothetical protein